jgi:hypothetical protein
VVNKLLTPSSLSPLGVLCALFGQLVDIYEDGRQPKAADLAQYRGLANDFGLTPMAQARIKPASDTSDENPFDEF